MDLYSWFRKKQPDSDAIQRVDPYARFKGPKTKAIDEPFESKLKKELKAKGLDRLVKGRCPDCNGREFFEGPSGGICTNWQCADEDCGSEFNIGITHGVLVLAERIGEVQPKKKPKPKDKDK